MNIILRLSLHLVNILCLGGFGFDFEGLFETSFLAGRLFNMALDFLGAGAGGARIFLHLIHFTLTKTYTVGLPL